jgi:uncharacterized delta-60 repeat protein
MAASFIVTGVLARLRRNRKRGRLPGPRVEELGERIVPAVSGLPIVSSVPPLVPPDVSFQGNPSAAGNAVALEQVNGETKILVAGYDTIDGNQDFALWRFNSDGSLDTTFGTGGLVTTNLGPGTGTDLAQALAVAVDPATGDIVLAGSALNGNTFNLNFALAVYLSDGTPDNRFGSGGTITTDFGSGGDAQINALAIDPKTDQIVVAGYAYNGVTFNNDFALARYNFDGSLDSSFGSMSGSFGPAGTVTVEFGAGAQANALAIDSAGNYVVAGSAWNSTTGNNDFALGRYNADGSLDGNFGATSSSFGPAGTVTTDFGSSDAQVNALAVDASGNYVVAGSGWNSTTGNNDFALGRYNADGSLDGNFGATSGSFGPAGTVATDFGSGDAQVNALAIDSAGHYIVAGNAFNSTTGNNDFALGRYNADGSLDSSFGATSGSFGPAGTVTTDFSSGDAEISGLAIDANGNYVTAGFAWNSATANDYVALSRLDGAGSLDSAFAAGYGGFGPAGTLTWEPDGAVALPPPADGSGGGVVLPPVPIDLNSGGVPVSDGSVGPTGPQPDVIEFAGAVPSSADGLPAAGVPVAGADDAASGRSASDLSGSHDRILVAISPTSTPATTSAPELAVSVGDVALMLSELHGSENLAALPPQTLSGTTAGNVPTPLSSALPGQLPTVFPPTAMGGGSEVHKDSVMLPSSFEDDGREQSGTDFGAPSAVKPAKPPAETTDTATDTTTPQAGPDDEAADEGDETY